MKIEDVKIGMRLIEGGSNGFKTPVVVTKLTEKGFNYKFVEDVHLGPRYGYISKDSECEAYHLNGEVMYKPDTEKEECLSFPDTPVGIANITGKAGAKMPQAKTVIPCSVQTARTGDDHT